jgi:anti-sigma regulatory factor (Ser/Thr protein kinase)
MRELTVAANIESLYEVMDFINGELERNNCAPELQDNINLAVEEVFTNIANHAYQPASGSAVISIAVGTEVVIRFEDTGKPYNPLEYPEPDFDMPLEEREIGGLGIFLVKKIMDKIDYERIDNKNVLTVTKKCDY